MSDTKVCRYCGEVIPITAVVGLCVPCQEAEGKRRGDPKNFEGERWVWHDVRYVPVQMCYGTIQTRYIASNAERSWRMFEQATGRTRKELKAQGYRVKRISIQPEWKVKQWKVKQ